MIVQPYLPSFWYIHAMSIQKFRHTPICLRFRGTWFITPGCCPSIHFGCADLLDQMNCPNKAWKQPSVTSHDAIMMRSWGDTQQYPTIVGIQNPWAEANPILSILSHSRHQHKALQLFNPPTFIINIYQHVDAMTCSLRISKMFCLTWKKTKYAWAQCGPNNLPAHA